MTALEQFRDNGFVEVAPREPLRSAVVHFYLDIVKYLVILLKDDGVQYGAEIAALESSLRTGSISAIDAALQAALFEVQKENRQLLGRIYEMGTRPNKFMSAEQLFSDDQIRDLYETFFRSKAPDNPDHLGNLYVKPDRGETLHLFTPGESQFKYNLPIHQDFQYLGQSTDQITFWLLLSGTTETGGVRIFPRTHKYGAVECTTNEHGHHEVDVCKLQDFDPSNFLDFGGRQFQLLAIDSLMLHQSLPSRSSYSSRLTYIWRISNIASANRVKLGLSF